MARKRGKKEKRERRRPRSQLGREWVGGRVVTPFYVTEPEPFRPDMVIWIECPRGRVLHFETGHPGRPELDLAAALAAAMEAPMVGPPRRPRRVRIADPAAAEAVRAAHPSIEVRVAPTPEIDRFLRDFAERVSADRGRPPSYLERGRVPAERVAALFEAAERLYGVAPWRRMSDIDVVRVDIPALCVEGACLSVVGALGESLGFLLFPSYLAFDAFVRNADRSEDAGPPDLGTDLLALTFERGADLPPEMRREVAEHGWPVAGADAYPSLGIHDRDNVSRPLGERDVRIATACARALAAWFSEHADRFEPEGPDGPVAPAAPVRGTHVDADGVEVRLTFPYDATAAEPGEREPGHGEAPGGERALAGFGEVDARMVDRLAGHASHRLGRAFAKKALAFERAATAGGIGFAWALHHARFDGEPVATSFEREHGHELSPPERDWLAAQREAWISAWEVRSVVPGREIELRDLLSGESRTVIERTASEQIHPRDAILARVVDFRGASCIAVCHPRVLRPGDAAAVLRGAREKLGAGSRDLVPPQRLREEDWGRELIERWDEAVEDAEARAASMPGLANTAGEPLLLTTDHFDVQGDPPEVERRLAAMEGARSPEPGDPERAIVFLDPEGEADAPGRTVIGRAVLARGKLRLETNSQGRADRLRERVEAACGGLVSHRMREHVAPLSALERGAGGVAPAPPPDVDPAELGALVREFKARHYASWADEPLPALGGRTPREAARTASGRDEVDLLLKEMESQEARLPAAERFDFSGLRAELGLPD